MDFAQTKSQKDTRPSSNESRALLSLRGLLLELLCVRYGTADGSEDETTLHDLGCADTQYIDAVPMSDAAAQKSHTAGSKKQKRQRTVVTGGGRIPAAASLRRPPPPPPPPAKHPPS
eukprot:6180056-Pleurochrysis_carterae.AAC.2